MTYETACERLGLNPANYRANIDAARDILDTAPTTEQPALRRPVSVVVLVCRLRLNSIVNPASVPDDVRNLPAC